MPTLSCAAKVSDIWSFTRRHSLWRAQAIFCFGGFDFCGQLVVALVERERFLPILERLRNLVQHGIGVANVLQDRWIISLQRLLCAQEFRQGLFVLAAAKMKPAEAIKVSPVLRVRRQRPFDIIFGLVQMGILVGPHETKIIIGLSSVRRIELDRLLEKVGGFVVKAGAFGGRAIFEKETAVGHVVALCLAFMQSFLEKRN